MRALAEREAEQRRKADEAEAQASALEGQLEEAEAQTAKAEGEAQEAQAGKVAAEERAAAAEYHNDPYLQEFQLACRANLVEVEGRVLAPPRALAPAATPLCASAPRPVRPPPLARLRPPSLATESLASHHFHLNFFLLLWCTFCKTDQS